MTTTEQYLATVQQVELVKKLLRPYVLSGDRARLILDPRVTDEEPVEGYVQGVSAPTEMLAFWRSAEDAELTLRRRIPLERDGRPGYLVSYQLVEILDVEKAD